MVGQMPPVTGAAPALRGQAQVTVGATDVPPAGRRILALSGNTHRPSKTRALVEAVGDSIAAAYGCAFQTYDMLDVQPDLGTTLARDRAAGMLETVLDEVERADVLIVGSPVYKGSYSGLFKHFIDLLHPDRMAGKPILITATGGGDRHALMVEHQLRPLFAFFTAHTIATAVYASDKHFVDGKLCSDEIAARVQAATHNLEPWLGTHRRLV